jgi:hypothetical protein
MMGCTEFLTERHDGILQMKLTASTASITAMPSISFVMLCRESAETRKSHPATGWLFL